MLVTDEDKEVVPVGDKGIAEGVGYRKNIFTEETEEIGVVLFGEE